MLLVVGFTGSHPQATARARAEARDEAARHSVHAELRVRSRGACVVCTCAAKKVIEKKLEYLISGCGVQFDSGFARVLFAPLHLKYRLLPVRARLYERRDLSRRRVHRARSRVACAVLRVK